MQNQIKVYLIYWLPDGVVLDTSVPDGIGNYETLTQRFFDDVSATPYLNITTQYPGGCGSNQCVLRNRAWAVLRGGAWVDSHPYPHAGTVSDPLQDSDIRDEVVRAIGQNGWSVDNNSEFFVITGVTKNTGKMIEECDGSGNCSFNKFCAYHGNFSSNGKAVLYSYLTDASFNTAGCDEGISWGPNGQLASDREVVLMTHEFIETVTDPLGSTWWNSYDGNEIGDNCNQIPATISLGSHIYVVQQEWSNISSSCVSSFGPSIELSIGTGGDDLRGDSSATAALQTSSRGIFETVTLKTESEPSWDNNTGHIVVFNYNATSASDLSNVAVTLTSHNSLLETDDNWNIQNITITVLGANGRLMCTQSYGGNPVVRLTGSAATHTFTTPSCRSAGSDVPVWLAIQRHPVQR
jgi:hypothetical protein